MLSCSSFVACILLTMATIVQSGHICNSGVHYFVEHTMKCRKQRVSFLATKNKETERYNEMLGCNLFDFTQGKRFNRFPDQQVHWPGGVAGLENFQYTQHDNVPGQSTCLMRSDCLANGTKTVWYCKNKNCSETYSKNEKCYGTTHEEFHMPDYCSRAIMSELSTVYNGVDRTTSIRAGAKVLFSSVDTCRFWDRKDSVIDSVLENVHREKACWNHVNDWRRMYCAKYHQCKCPDGMSTEDCSKQANLVNCCKNRYQEFLDSKYNTYKGYPLKKECQENKNCAYNPASKPQQDFDQSEVKDFSRLY